MKKIVVMFLCVIAVLYSCSSTEKVENVPEPEIVVDIPEATVPVQETIGVFYVDGQMIAGGLAAVEIDGYVYAAGLGDLGYQVTSINQAKANVMQVYAEYINTSIVSAMENYAQGGGIVDSSLAKDMQSVVNNALGTRVESRAQLKGVEYIQMQVTENEAVYVLARVRKDNLNEAVKKEAQDIARNDASVKANKEASDFFSKLASEGIF